MDKIIDRKTFSFANVINVLLFIPIAVAVLGTAVVEIAVVTSIAITGNVIEFPGEPELVDEDTAS